MQTAEAQKDAPKIEPVFDEDDVPAGKLDDAEIARLVSLSSKAAYNRTDNIPVKPKESFEPRTLVTIAMEAQRRREAELQESAIQETVSTATSDDAEAADTAAEAADNVAAGDVAPDSPAGDAGTDTAAAADVADEEAPLPGAGEADAGEPELSEEEIAAAAAAAKLQAEYERGLAEGRATGEETGHKAGHDKGYEAGRAAGQAEATAQLETAIQGFEKATLALASAATLDLDALTARIHDAILSLASERAGMAIAEMPEAFAGRIESILATIKQGADHPQISLNPDDLLALKPIIATRERLQNCSLDADETLAPGDVRLVIDGIGIEDELHRRVSGKVAVQPADVSATEPSTPSMDAGATITEAAAAEADIAETDIVNPANAEAAMASTAGDNAPGESSASPETAGEGGFSIGLKPKAEAEDAGAPAAGTADAAETDQS
ncbi:MAG: FliH/SctL family protein [Candidatus Puniceispirillaceae bacterium]